VINVHGPSRVKTFSVPPAPKKAAIKALFYDTVPVGTPSVTLYITLSGLPANETVTHIYVDSHGFQSGSSGLTVIKPREAYSVTVTMPGGTTRVAPGVKPLVAVVTGKRVLTKQGDHPLVKKKGTSSRRRSSGVP
jgi:hypothetical protein